jgi:hypothetical protein
MRNNRFVGVICVGAVALLLQSCQLAEQFRRQSEANSAGSDAPTEVASTIGNTAAYLELMSGLGTPDRARQADLFYEVEREYTRAPTTASTLRYAVALVTPGHPASSPSEGKRLLETLLATPERLTQDERTLTAVLLHETDVRLKLEAENRRLLATLDDRGRTQTNADRRIQAQIEENARLRRALAEAQQKLDAIKEIEKSIIERSPTPPGNRDVAPSETQSPPANR